MSAIAARLRRMRAAGIQPDVVALQEAFGADAKGIGRAAGYRYVALGPSATLPTVAPSAADRTFSAGGSLVRGEGWGMRLDSGLAIFSDHPILAARHIAFSSCAGYDCLANKGALAVLIAVPGSGPITVVDTHLNAARASGVDRARHRRAFERQVEELAAFNRSVAQPGTALLVAGDFNVGHDPVRDAAFRSRLTSSGDALSIAAAACLASRRCAVTGRADVGTSLARRKDWLLYRAARSGIVHPIAFAAPFGRERDGTMLSDHVGVMVR
jgi:endonuclease/exonuclease/phosphatase family metal-dependent hydrolase